MADIEKQESGVQAIVLAKAKARDKRTLKMCIPRVGHLLLLGRVR